MSGISNLFLFGNDEKTKGNIINFMELSKYVKKNTDNIMIGYITNVKVTNMRDIGSYIIIINTKSVVNGPCGVYAISKSNIKLSKTIFIPKID